MLECPKLIEFPKIGDPKLGYISIAEHGVNIDFNIKRVYWTYYTPNDVIRGGHAHRELEQLIFALSGNIEFNTEDLYGNKQKFILNRPNLGLYLPKLIWRDIVFSHNAVLLCLASEIYKEEDYFRDYEDFKKFK